MKHVLKPFRFKVLSAAGLPSKGNLLDVGCGSHSPSITKKWLPEWTYHGLDRENYGNDEADFEVMEAFYQLDLSRDHLSEIPEAHFDLIIMSHVIEHLPDGLDVVRGLATKLKPGGLFYIEFPSARSLRLPSMEGTLHFCDDHTHIRVYQIAELANTLLDAGFRIVRAAPRRDRVRIALLPLLVPVKFLLRGKLSAGDFWDVTGFAEYILASRGADSTGSAQGT